MVFDAPIFLHTMGAATILIGVGVGGGGGGGGGGGVETLIRDT